MRSYKRDSAARRLCELRDDAFSASEVAHSRMERELMIYNNTAYDNDRVRLGSLKPLVGESFDPRVTSAVNRLIPAYMQQIPKIEVFPDRHSQTESDVELTGVIQNWLEMMNEVDDEPSRLRTFVHHNLIMGNAIGKVYWDAENYIVRAPAIDPTSFAPDGKCANIDFSDADYLCHCNDHLGRIIHQKYGLRMRSDDSTYRVDELWLRKDIADWAGIDVSGSVSPIVLVTLINDRVFRATENPNWYPGFPFAAWRHFHELIEGKAQSFWGFGYGSLLWPDQKLLDELWANVVLITRNIAVGRYITTKGTLDMDQIMAEHGMIIELLDQKKLEDIQYLAPEEVPASLFNMISLVNDRINEQVPSNTPAFVGESPHSQASGKLAETLQEAAYSQLSDNVMGMTEFRRRRARIKVSLIQQNAERPVEPHLWRYGIDVPDNFPEDARFVGCHPSVRDMTMFPNTPQGKMQAIQALAMVGVQLNPEKYIELLQLDQEFGIRTTDLAMQPMMEEQAAQAAQPQSK